MTYRHVHTLAIDRNLALLLAAGLVVHGVILLVRALRRPPP
jgi:hypothetical protein